MSNVKIKELQSDKIKKKKKKSRLSMTVSGKETGC